MEKENAQGKESSRPNLLDAASLFGASYWPRPDGSNAATGSPLFGGYPSYSSLMGRGAGGGGGGGTPGAAAGFPPTSPYGTLSIAANQAANLGISPAWWNMASQLAAQDYLASLQFAGLASNMLPVYPLLPPHLSGGKSRSGTPQPAVAKSSPPSAASSLPPTPPAPAKPPPSPLSAPPHTGDIVGGVRLPPDTELIKFTSSMLGPKTPGNTNRGRKKTISLDHLAAHHQSLKQQHHTSKPSQSKGGGGGGGGYVGLDLSGKRKADITPPMDDSPYLRYEGREGTGDGGGSEGGDGRERNGQGSPPPPVQDEGPLNLSLKPLPSSLTNHQSALESLSALSQNLGQTSDRSKYSRRKPGPKPRKVSQCLAMSESSRPSSGSEDADSLPASFPQHHKDGRPRNLGRGVSKPKKNTVASLLAQSRALGLKPGLEMAQLAALAKCSAALGGLYQQQPSSAGGGGSAAAAAAAAAAMMQESLGSWAAAAAAGGGGGTTGGRTTPPPPPATPRSLFGFSTSTTAGPGVPLESRERDETNLSSSPNSCTDQPPHSYFPSSMLMGREEDLKSLLTDESRSDLSESSSGSEMTDKHIISSRDGTGGLGGGGRGSGGGGKRRKMIDEGKLRAALERGWRRETYITSVGRAGVRGEVVYTSPCRRTFKHLGDLARFLEKQQGPGGGGAGELTRENFSFSCRILLGDYIETVQGKPTVRLSEETLASKLQEIMAQHRAALDQSKLERDRMALAAKEARRLAKEEAARQKEQLRLVREQERCERQEAARREKEHKNQQLIEARKKKQEEMERQRLEGQQRKQLERELKRQQAAIMKEQMYMQELNKQREILYTVELERERRRQHMGLVKALEVRKKVEEREKKRIEQRAEKLATREKRMEQRKLEVELLRELRKPVEDMELTKPKPMPELERIPGLRLSGQAFADALMTYEFLHNFGETLGFDVESLPSLNSLQEALLGDSEDAEEELLSVMSQLVICGIEDPGIPHPARHTTLLGQSLKQADISHNNLSEILRIYLYANATGEVKATSGVNFEREREKKVTEHHNNMTEAPSEETSGKNIHFYSMLKENETYKMSEWLKKRPFLSLNPTRKAAILAFLCHELLQNKAVIRQIDSAIETVAQLKRERWPIEANLRKLRHLQARSKKALGVALTSKEQEAVMTEDDGEVESLNDSDITQPDDEELSRLQIGESLALVEKQAEINTKGLADYGSKLRATCVGQDRYCRRYWCLSTGLYVEGIESADPQLFHELEKETDDWGAEDGAETEEKMDVDGGEEESCRRGPEAEEGVEGRATGQPELEEERRTAEENGRTGVKKEELEEVEEDKTPSPPVLIKEESSPLKSSQSSLQFERLGECMEEESKGLNGLTSTHSTNTSCISEDAQWFSLLPREACDSSGSCTGPTGGGGFHPAGNDLRLYDSCNETGGGGGLLRIPLVNSPCPSPLPLSLSVEEAAILEHCKTHGLPKPGRAKPIPDRLKRGWWKISVERMMEVANALEPRGIREREFLSTITRLRTEHAWESTLKVCTSHDAGLKMEEGGVGGDEDAVPAEPDPPDSWNRGTALRLDLAALAAVEALEEKVASASMQLKGWKVPAKATVSDIPFAPSSEMPDPSVNPISIAKERLSNLFDAIEKRYLKPPLGQNIGDLKLSGSCGGGGGGGASGEEGPGGGLQGGESKGLTVWREALSRAQSAAQLSMVLYALETSIAWDKSIMKANCQFCHSGDNEDKLLLCDGCDKGYHTYCFRPKMENIPEGDWFCHQCLNKARGEKNCIVCGRKVGRNLLACDTCPVAFHTDCMTPPLSKVPRGKWHCSVCSTKHPKRKNCRRSVTLSASSLSPLKADELNNSTESLNTAVTSEDEATKRSNEKASSGGGVAGGGGGGGGGAGGGGGGGGRRLPKDLAACRQLLEDLESHDDAWPFLLAVNTKQFPTYKKIIRNPMDLQTISKRLAHNEYKSRDEFASDVRLIFDNCETFNEDNSPVGKAGHSLRLYFETRWAELSTKP